MAEIKTEITENQVLEFMRARAREVRDKHGTYAIARIQAAIWVEGTHPEIECSVSANGLTQSYSGATFAEAMQASEQESPERRAQQKREQAAKLIAEAETLEGRTAA